MKHCCNPTQEQFEFPILENCYIINNQNLHIKDFNSNNLCELKLKIICDFQDIIDKLECGIQPDLEPLLQEILLVYLQEDV